jgi:hypothetical protein
MLVGSWALIMRGEGEGEGEGEVGVGGVEEGEEWEGLRLPVGEGG